MGAAETKAALQSTCRVADQGPTNHQVIDSRKLLAARGPKGNPESCRSAGSKGLGSWVTIGDQNSHQKPRLPSPKAGGRGCDETRSPQGAAQTRWDQRKLWIRADAPSAAQHRSALERETGCTAEVVGPKNQQHHQNSGHRQERLSRGGGVSRDG